MYKFKCYECFDKLIFDKKKTIWFIWCREKFIDMIKELQNAKRIRNQVYL